MRTFLLFCLVSVCESAASPVVGVQGQNVTLKCTYNVKKNSYKPACWTRGPLPTFGCGETIVSTDGYIVTKESGRYRLRGRLQDGDVSLTILNVKKEDTAMYSCRVEIFGLFNDEKHTIKLIVEDASDGISFKTSTQSNAIIRATYAPTTSLEGLQNSSSITTMTKNKQRSIPKLIILLGVLFGLIFVLTVAVIVRIFGGRWQRMTKIHQQRPSDHSVRFSSTSSSLHIYQQATAVNNIYQMEESEYDYIR